MLILQLAIAHGATLTVGPAAAYTTLDSALGDARDGDEVVIEPGTYAVSTRNVNSRDVVVRAAQGPGTVTVQLGAGAAWLRLNNSLYTLVDLDIDGQDQTRVATFANRASLIIQGGSIRDVAAPSGEDGGLASIGDGTLSMTGVQVTGGRARNGGFLDIDAGEVDLTGCTFQGGVAARGGAVNVEADTRLTVSETDFINNEAQLGAALAIAGGTLLVVNAQFTGNTGDRGTAWCGQDANCTLQDAWFTGNTVAVGSVLATDGLSTTAWRSAVGCQNHADTAFDLQGGDVELDGVVLFDHALSGSLFTLGPAASLTVRHSHLVRAVSAGPSAIASGAGAITLNSTLVAYNEGSGAALSAATVSTAYSLFWENTAQDLDQPLSASDLSADPLWVGLPTSGCAVEQLRPTWGSPLLDAGDPTRTGPDLTVSDIGAFGGPFTSPDIPNVDADSDGAGVPFDCDDTVQAVHPGAPEVGCNGVDDDCDPSTADLGDRDGDGVDACDDCDDNDASTYPGAPDPPRDGIDQDCDGVDIDDLDGDGFGYLEDCNDDDGAVFPGAPEQCNGLDDNCDGEVDEDLTRRKRWLDKDGDGYGVGEAAMLCANQAGYAPRRGDCDDKDPARYPGAVEVPDDGIDQNCTGADASATLVGRYGYRCGCQSSGSGAAPLAMLLGLLALRRRRQFRSPPTR